jgi:hypothetical protein
MRIVVCILIPDRERHALFITTFDNSFQTKALISMPYRMPND